LTDSDENAQGRTTPKVAQSTSAAENENAVDAALTRTVRDRVTNAESPEEARQWTLVLALNARIARDDRTNRAQSFEIKAQAAFPYVRLGMALITGFVLFGFGYLEAALLIFGVGFSPDIGRFFRHIMRDPGDRGAGDD
jgi:hypothetical protein